MATVQSLKKKLQVIRSTKKLTRAMKTASTVKYSKLSGLYADYAKYEKQCEALYQAYRNEFNSVFSFADSTAPGCYIVLSSNKGMCGSFNTELLNLFEQILEKEEKAPVVFVCGKKGKEYFDKKGVFYQKDFVFEDVPSFESAKKLFDKLRSLIKEGEISSVKIVYPQYINMMKQSPVCSDLFSFDLSETAGEAPLFFPDKETVINNTAENILISILYKKILETALGAQAATLTTMRSAYDTACQYSEQLEAEINRKRQSQVTADVIETSAEFSVEKEE